MVSALFGCGGGSGCNTTATNVVYTQSNEPGGNPLLAYRRAADGTLTPPPGSPFDLKGTGLANPMEVLGPPDDDQQIIATPDHRLLFAVNAGWS